MNKQEINIAIAESLGAKWYTQINGCKILSFGHPSMPLGVNRTELGDARILSSNIPSYTTDLNAMHEVEKKFTENLPVWWKYSGKLSQLNSQLGQGGEAHATAYHRAVTYLRTLDLWKD